MTDELPAADRSLYSLTTAQTAEYLGVSRVTLEVWRRRGKRGEISHAPPYAKLGKLIRYSRAALDEWQRSNVIATPSRTSP